LRRPDVIEDTLTDPAIPLFERSKLYQDVWSRPCTKIAAELEQEIAGLQAEALAREEEIEELVGGAPFLEEDSERDAPWTAWRETRQPRDAPAT
jgi:hypothetical protein